MIQSFSIFNGNNFPESYLSKVFTLSSNLSYVAAPGTARHCYVETVTLRLARSQQNIVTERRCVKHIKIYFTQDYEENVAGCMLTKPAELCTYGYWHILKAILDFVGIFAASFLVGYQLTMTMTMMLMVIRALLSTLDPHIFLWSRKPVRVL